MMRWVVARQQHRHLFAAALPSSRREKILRRRSSSSSSDTNAAYETAALTALRRVVDPLVDEDVVTAGMVDLTRGVGGTTTTLRLDVGTPAHPAQRQIAEACAAALGDVAGTGELDVTLSASGFGARVSSKHPGLRSVRSAIAVTSCKGGVGKSTVALKLAEALSAMGARVGILDADVHGPSLPTLLGSKNVVVEESPAGGGLMLPVVVPEFSGLRAASIGFIGSKAAKEQNVVLGIASGAMRGPLAGRVAEQLATLTDWGELDYLVVDMPPGVGDVHLTLHKAIGFDGALLVTTPSELAKADVGRGAALLRDLGIPVLALLENMAYFTCGSCDEKHRLFGDGHVAQLASELGLTEDCCFEMPVSTVVSTANEKSESLFFSPKKQEEEKPQGFLRGLLFPRKKKDDDAISTLSQMAEAIVVQIYSAQHASRARVDSLAWDDRLESLVLRTFADGGALEQTLDAQNLRKGHSRRQKELEEKQTATPPLLLKPTKITPVGKLALAIDWNDGLLNDVYTIENIRSLAAASSTSAQTDDDKK